MKYNRSEIMKEAWKLYRMSRKWVNNIEWTFSRALKRAWAMAKEAVAEAAERTAKGIVRMHYSEYKNKYSNCQTVEGSYDKRTKTIEVMTKITKKIRIGICPHCHTYCYGDCTAK